MQLIVTHQSGDEVRYDVTTESEIAIRNDGAAEAFSLQGIESIALELSHFDAGVETAGEEYARLNPEHLQQLGSVKIQTRVPVAPAEHTGDAEPEDAKPKKFWGR